MTRVAVLVLNWNGARWLPRCFDALLQQTGSGVELDTWVIDNGSTDGSIELMRTRYPRVNVMPLGRNLGFGAAYNRAIAHVTTPFVALLNNDTAVEPGWLQALCDELTAHPSTAAVGSKLLFMHAPGRVNHAGGRLTVLGAAFDCRFGAPDDASEQTGNSGCATGAAVLLNREAFLNVGGFDERYFAYFEDADLCWRFWLNGYAVRYTPRAVVLHAYGGSSGAGRASLFRIEHCQANRLQNMIKHLEASTLRWAVPASFAYDGWRMAEAARGGRWPVVRALARGWGRFQRQLSGVLANRNSIQARRTRSDGELFDLRVLVGLREARTEWQRLTRLGPSANGHAE